MPFTTVDLTEKGPQGAQVQIQSLPGDGPL